LQSCGSLWGGQSPAGSLLKNSAQKSDIVAWIELQPDTRGCQRVGRAAAWQVGCGNVWPTECAVDESGRRGAYDELVVSRELPDAKRASAAELLLNIGRKQTKCRPCIDIARVGKGRYKVRRIPAAIVDLIERDVSAALGSAEKLFQIGINL
jgi:hypothetical protein